MLILGVDEAGKGPVIGSMFVAGLVFEEDKIFDLAAAGVKDSKLLTPVRREFMEKKILSLVEDHYVLEVTSKTIDELRSVISMNDIMVRSHSLVVKNLKADRAILDAADVLEDRFARRVKEQSGTSMEIHAEHKADMKHLVVAAASVIAKVNRDRSMRQLEIEMGCDIGSGYPADPKTKRFLKEWQRQHNDLPPCARRSWATSKRLTEEKS